MLRWVHLKVSMVFVDASCGTVGEDSIVYDCHLYIILLSSYHCHVRQCPSRQHLQVIAGPLPGLSLLCPIRNLVIGCIYRACISRQTFDRLLDLFYPVNLACNLFPLAFCSPANRGYPLSQRVMPCLVSAPGIVLTRPGRHDLTMGASNSVLHSRDYRLLCRRGFCTLQ